MERHEVRKGGRREGRQEGDGGVDEMEEERIMAVSSVENIVRGRAVIQQLRIFYLCYGLCDRDRRYGAALGARLYNRLPNDA